MNGSDDLPMKGERLARFVAGECSAEERAEIEVRLREDPDLADLVASLNEVWARTGAASASWDVDRAWEEFEARRSVRDREHVTVLQHSKAPTGIHRRPSTTVWLQAAAAVVLLVGGTAIWHQLTLDRSAESVAIREFVTGPAEQIEIDLPDGSRVTLAPESSLRLDPDFGSGTRGVTLEGQAVFQVSHDPGRPFRVVAGNVMTEVLGTRFGVRAYDTEVSVALAEGSVRVRTVEDDEGQRALTLEPGQVARAMAGGEVGFDPEAGLARLLDWTEGRLVFRDTPLGEAAQDLSRWYDVEIRFADSIAEGRRLTATFDRESVSQVMDLIALSLNLRYDRNGRVIVLSSP